jgi:hypothetical protein
MNDMTLAGIGHNGGPDPIDQINAQFESWRIEAENWTDGNPVEDEAQMKVADAVRAAIRDWRIALEKGQKDATAPLYDAYKAELERWKPTITDAKRIEGCLVSSVGDFKKRIAAEKAEAKRKADADAARKMREAEEAAKTASAMDLDAQREADAKMREADLAVKAAAEAKRDQVKGLRTVHKWAYEVDPAADPKAARRPALNDIAVNDPDAIAAFVDDYVARNFRNRPIAGVRTWSQKEAF